MSGNHTHLKFKLETVEKNVSTIGRLTGIEPMPLQCQCNAQVARALHCYRKRVGSIPTGGPTVNAYIGLSQNNEEPGSATHNN